MTDFAIGRSEGRCEKCGQSLSPGDEFFSVILERPEGFARQDICAGCWEGAPEGAYCHFKTRLPAHEEKRRVFVDDEVLLGFFHRLGEQEEDEIKAGFRFVLTLILLRKRVFRYEQAMRESGREYWQVRLVRDQSVYRVRYPPMDEERVQLLTGELGAILRGHAGEAADAAAIAPGTPGGGDE